MHVFMQRDVVLSPTLESLPDETLVHVLGFLDSVSLSRIAEASRRLAAIATTDSLWRNLYHAEFSSLSPVQSHGPHTTPRIGRYKSLRAAVVLTKPAHARDIRNDKWRVRFVEMSRCADTINLDPIRVGGQGGALPSDRAILRIHRRAKVEALLGRVGRVLGLTPCDLRLFKFVTHETNHTRQQGFFPLDERATLEDCSVKRGTRLQCWPRDSSRGRLSLVPASS